MNEFQGKTPEEAASILKSRARGVKRVAEEQCWPIIFEAKRREDAGTEAFFTEVVRALLEGTEQPRVDTNDPRVRRLAA